jgi:hypothetical protein
MRILKNEKGVALITALLLAVIGLLMIGGLFVMLKGGIWSSGSQKRYQTALEASYGVLDIMTKDVIPRAISNTAGTSLSTLGNYSGLLNAQTTDACFTDKLTKLNAGTNWSADCSLNSLLIPTANADLVFNFQFPAPQPAIDVFAKIVDTVPGNSSQSGVQLEGEGVVSSGSGIVTPQHLPYMYRIEIQGQNAANPRENAQLSVLYAY